MLINRPSTKDLLQIIDSFDLTDLDCLLICTSEACKISLKKVIKHCNSNNITLIGGIFPAVIYDTDIYDKGVLIKKFPLINKPILIKNNHVNFTEIFNENAFPKDEKVTALILSDGFSANIPLFLNELINFYGNSLNYFGAGAGSTHERIDCIFSNEGIFRDASIISMINLDSKLGVKHGWKKIHSPIVATSTAYNLIKQLNWDNPFNIYKKIIFEDSGIKITKSNFKEVASAYPFGIYRENEEYVIRDPVQVSSKGHIRCLGEISENTILHIVKANNQDIINAAGEAAKACKIPKQKKIKHNLLIDCITREQYLQDQFKQELQAVKRHLKIEEEEHNLHGVLSLGEISSFGESFIDVFNKTVVVCVLY